MKFTKKEFSQKNKKLYIVIVGNGRFNIGGNTNTIGYTGFGTYSAIGIGLLFVCIFFVVVGLYVSGIWRPVVPVFRRLFGMDLEWGRRRARRRAEAAIRYLNETQGMPAGDKRKAYWSLNMKLDDGTVQEDASGFLVRCTCGTKNRYRDSNSVYNEDADDTGLNCRNCGKFWGIFEGFNL